MTSEFTPTYTETIAIRRAGEADRAALERLAALDSSSPPSGEVLIAEVGGEVQVAVEIAGGTAIADPFRPTAHLVELVSLRAARVRDGVPRPHRLRLHSRSAYRAA